MVQTPSEQAIQSSIPSLKDLIPFPKPYFDEGEVVDWHGIPCVVNDIFLNPNVLGAEGKNPIVYQLAKPEGHQEENGTDTDAQGRFLLVKEEDLVAANQEFEEEQQGDDPLLIREAIETACYELGLVL